VRAGRAVTFDHQRGGVGGPVQRRTVEPWGVVSWRGRWYLCCYDRDRTAPRCFRISRIMEPVTPVGPAGAVQVPEGVDLMGMVRQGVDPPPATDIARVWIADGRAHGLRRLGRVVGRHTHAGRSGDEVELDVRNVETLARWVAGHGPDVAVLGPQHLAAAVRANWAASVAAHTEPLART
jgi:proteasome accessory factor B